jgi:ribulose-5-phosphate 4-epimerase/fuculose-1-phosphate aldolase
MTEELYTGPKFETIFLEKNIPGFSDLTRLIHWCSVFHRERLAPAHEKGTAGNLSFRLFPSGMAFMITAAGLTAKCRLQQHDFVCVEDCDLQQRKVFVNGNRQPSSESLMHYQIYQIRPDISAVFHGHHQYLVEFGENLDLPVTATECQYGTVELAQSIIPVAANHDFFIIRNHGFVSLGQTMDQAGEKAIYYLKCLADMKR